MHIATQLSYHEIVAKLIEAKADVNAQTRNGSTPLKGAAQVGDVKIIDMLVKAGADQNSEDDVGCTPLHEAASEGHSKAVEKLLELKADPNIRESRYNLTAADLADNRGYYATRDILLAEMDYQSVFIKNIHYTLFKWKETFMKENVDFMVETALLGFSSSFLERSVEFQFVSQLANDVASIENADDLFKKVSASFKSSAYEAVKDSLLPLRRSIIVHMKQYNQDKVSAVAKEKDFTLSASFSKAYGYKEKKPEPIPSRRKKAKKRNKGASVFSLIDEVCDALQTKREMPLTAAFDSAKNEAIKEQRPGEGREVNDNPKVVSPSLVKTVHSGSVEIKASYQNPLKQEEPPVTRTVFQSHAQVKGTPLLRTSVGRGKKWIWRPVVRTTPSASDALSESAIAVTALGRSPSNKE